MKTYDTMTVSELLQALINEQEKKFKLDMIDHWDREDFKLNDTYSQNIYDIKAALSKKNVIANY